MILRYQSGEEIKKSDKVLFHRNSAAVELAASDPLEPDQAWYIREYGGGVMISDPSVSDNTFIDARHIDKYEDLEFVSNADEQMTRL